MKHGVAYVVAVLLCLAPLVGVWQLRRDARELYDSALRFGEPNPWIGSLMGARTPTSAIELQPMESIDQFWFAFDNRTAAQLIGIAEAMVEGEDKMGARAVACMSTLPNVHLEDPEAEFGDVSVCLAAGAGDLQDLEPCTAQMWSMQTERLVLLSVFGRDTQLRRNDLVGSCRAMARHWQQWSDRR